MSFINKIFGGSKSNNDNARVSRPPAPVIPSSQQQQSQNQWQQSSSRSGSSGGGFFDLPVARNSNQAPQQTTSETASGSSAGFPGSSGFGVGHADSSAEDQSSGPSGFAFTNTSGGGNAAEVSQSEAASGFSFVMGGNNSGSAAAEQERGAEPHNDGTAESVSGFSFLGGGGAASASSQGHQPTNSVDGKSDSVKHDADSAKDASSFSFLRASPSVSDRGSEQIKGNESESQNQSLPPIQKAKKKKKRSGPLVGYARSKTGDDLETGSVASSQRMDTETNRFAGQESATQNEGDLGGHHSEEQEAPLNEAQEGGEGVLAGLKIHSPPVAANTSGEEATNHSTQEHEPIQGEEDEGKGGVLSGLNIRQCNEEPQAEYTVEASKVEGEDTIKNTGKADEEDEALSGSTGNERESEEDGGNEVVSSPLQKLELEQKNELKSIDECLFKIEELLSSVPQELQSSASSLTNRWQQLQDDIRELSETRKKTDERIADLQKEVARTQKDVDQAVSAEEFENAEALNQTLESFKYELEDALQQQDQQTNRLVELEDERASLLDDTSQALEKLVTKLSEGKSFAKSSLDQTKRTLEEHRQSVKEKVDHERQQLNFKQARVERELNHIKEERSTVETAISEEGGAVERERDQVEQDMRKLSEEIKELERKLEQKRHQHEKAKGKYESLDKRVKDIRAGYAKQLERLQKREKEVENEQREYEEQIDAIRAQEKGLHRYVEDEETRLATLEKHLSELQFDSRCTHAVIKCVNSAVDQRKTFIKEIRQDENNLKDLHSKLVSRNASVQDIEGKLHLKEVEYANEEKTLQNVNEQVSNFSEQKRKAVDERRFKEASRLKNELDSLEKKKEDLSSKTRTLAGEIDELTSDRDSKSNELESVRDEVKAVEEKVKKNHLNLALKALQMMKGFQHHLETKTYHDGSSTNSETRDRFMTALQKLVNVQIKGLQEEARSLGAKQEELDVEGTMDPNTTIEETRDSDEEAEGASNDDGSGEGEQFESMTLEELQETVKQLDAQIEEKVSEESYDEADSLERKRKRIAAEIDLRSNENVDSGAPAKNTQEGTSSAEDNGIEAEDSSPVTGTNERHASAYDNLSLDELKNKAEELERLVEEAAEAERYEEADSLESEQRQIRQIIEERGKESGRDGKPESLEEQEEEGAPQQSAEVEPKTALSEEEAYHHGEEEDQSGVENNSNQEDSNNNGGEVDDHMGRREEGAENRWDAEAEQTDMADNDAQNYAQDASEIADADVQERSGTNEDSDEQAVTQDDNLEDRNEPSELNVEGQKEAIPEDQAEEEEEVRPVGQESEQ
eukprot:gb/GECG01013973.1/.p1 GENE.gb/GECG01013973.1/~~gb/GECG01013973.1/.p1  ORF type:complete len:1315 (+),score=362.44 gb/GECG01013973.1/:1-3945(+)